MSKNTSRPKHQDFVANATLEKEPEFAEALGHLCAAWSSLEFQMMKMFHAVSGASIAISRTIFYSINANRTRIEMLKVVAAVVLGAGSELSIELDGLLSRIQRTAKRRNDFVHDTWLVAQTTKREVMQFRLSGNEIGSEMEPLQRNDLTQLTDQILRHIHGLNTLQAKIERAAPPLLQKLHERKALNVAYAKRGTPRERRPKGPPPHS